MSALVDLTGERFGRLTVRRRGHDWRSSNGRSMRVRWECDCDCGNEALVFGNDLRRGRSTSCGCLHDEQLVARQLRHGHAKSGGQKTMEYRRWSNAKRGRKAGVPFEEFARGDTAPAVTEPLQGGALINM
jgi:hypothetical protein